MFHSSNLGISLLIATVSLTSVAGAAFISAFVARKFRTVGYLTDLLSQQYGFLRLRYQARYEIFPDGSSRGAITECIRAINLPVAGVEHFSQILTARKEELAPFSVKGVKLNGKSEGPDIRVVPKITLSDGKRLYYQLLYEPMLQPKQEIEYSFEVIHPPHTFATTEDKLFERKLPFDFISMKIAYPTEQFVMEVSLPEELLAEDLAFDVWLGDARLRLNNEYQRLMRESALKLERLDGRQVARLMVTYPILDLKYVITWRATKREQL